MERKRRLTSPTVSLIICLLVILIIDFWLARFGQSALFKAELPHGVTLGYDKLEGYKFLEEGVIHIVDEHTIYGQDTLAAILAYGASASDVFIKARSTTGKIVYLNIHVLVPDNGELRYDLLDYKPNGSEDWIDVSDKRAVRLVRTLRNLLGAVAIVMFVFLLFQWIRLGLIRRA